MADSNDPNKGTPPAGGPWQEREAKISREILRRSERAAHGVSVDDIPEEKPPGISGGTPTPSDHEHHPTTKTLDYIALGIIIALAPTVMDMYIRHEDIDWLRVAVSFAVSLALGIVLLWFAHGWRSTAGRVAAFRARINRADDHFWVRATIIAFFMIAPVLITPLISRSSHKQVANTAPEIYRGVFYPTKLGAYIREDVSEGSYEAGYENATVFWNHDSSIFYILSASTQTWVEQRETSAPPPPYYDNAFLRKIFSDTPKGKLPPYAGLAKLWQNDPRKWRTLLGWRDWNCALEKTHFQEFENGYVIGVLFNSPNPAADRGLIWILYKDGGWDQQQLGAASAPVCNPLN